VLGPKYNRYKEGIIQWPVLREYFEKCLNISEGWKILVSKSVECGAQLILGVKKLCCVMYYVAE
jgi:hypothetical protein